MNSIVPSDYAAILDRSQEPHLLLAPPQPSVLSMTGRACTIPGEGSASRNFGAPARGPVRPVGLDHLRGLPREWPC